MKMIMGYDGSASNSIQEILQNVTLMKNKGLIKAGYKVIIFPCALIEDMESVSWQVLSLGGIPGLSLGVQDRGRIRRAVSAGYSFFKLIGRNDQKELAELAAEIREIAPDAIISTVSSEDDAKNASSYADIFIADDQSNEIDFYEITRNQYDSCFGSCSNEFNLENSLSRRRARLVAETDMLCQLGLFPLSETLDFERMRAIICLLAIMKSPIFLQGNLAAHDALTLSLLTSPEILDILTDLSNPGSASRYYDPWHVLFSRDLADGQQLTFILNRCHGNTSTVIISEDLRLPTGTAFDLYDIFEHKLVQVPSGVFDILVSTSDQADTPCCKLYRTVRDTN